MSSKRTYTIPVDCVIPLEIDVEAASPYEALAIAKERVSSEKYEDAMVGFLYERNIYFYRVDN